MLRLDVVTMAGRATIGELASRDEGIDQTIACMRVLVADAALHENIQDAARRLATPEGIESWLRRAVAFQADPDGIEMLQSPAMLMREWLSMPAPQVVLGDCDDNAMLGASLLAALQFETVFIVVGKTPRNKGGRFQHVFYGYLRDPKGPLLESNVVPFDAQEGMTPGKWPAKFPRVRIYRASWSQVS